MPNLDILWWSIWWGRRSSGPLNLPLSPPRALRFSQNANGVTFTWSPPFSFGTAGPAAMPYEYSVQLSTEGGPAVGTRPWSNPAVITAATVTIDWSTPATEVLRFRVRARDGNTPVAGKSGWTTSAIVTEGAEVPVGGPFARTFGALFDRASA